MQKQGIKKKFRKALRIPYTQFIPMVVVLNWSFTFFVTLIESGMCDYSEYPEEIWQAMTNADVQTAFKRHVSDLPFMLAIFEGLIGLGVTLVPSIVSSLGDLIPGALITTLVIVRVYSTGMLGCYDTEHMCCGNMACPNSLVSVSIDGCGEGDFVYWRDTSNYCPIPAWYLGYKNTCGQLSKAQDVVPCYTYGCSYTATPLRYVANRVWIVLSVMLILGLVQDMISIEIIESGTIKILKSKRKV